MGNDLSRKAVASIAGGRGFGHDKPNIQLDPSHPVKATSALFELAEIWTAAHPALGRPPRLSDLGAAVLNAKRFSLSLPSGKTS